MPNIASSLLLVLLAFPGLAAAASTQYEVDAKVLELTGGTASPVVAGGFASGTDIAALISQPGVSAMSLPRVTCSTMLPARIEITREVTLAAGQPRKVGVTLAVMPTKALGVYSVQFENVLFCGYRDEAAREPIFSIQRVSMDYTTAAPGRDYQCFNLPAKAPLPVPTYDKTGKPQKPTPDKLEKLFLKITPA